MQMVLCIRSILIHLSGCFMCSLFSDLVHANHVVNKIECKSCFKLCEQLTENKV